MATVVGGPPYGESSDGLPPLLARFLERSVAVREPLPRRIRLEQTGEMQLKPGRWSVFRAKQESLVERVEFSWRADFTLAPLLRMRVLDWYRDGEGGLVARLWGLVPVIRGTGANFAKGEAMRYLAELPWVPPAILGNRALAWREIDDRTIEVSTDVASERAAVQLHFNEAADIVGSSANARPRMEGRRVVERPFGGYFDNYEDFSGVRVPTKAEVYWELPEGRFTYFRAELSDFEYE